MAVHKTDSSLCNIVKLGKIPMNDDSIQPMNGMAIKLLDVADDGIYVVDKAMNIVAANDTVVKWSKKNGYKDEIIGKHALEVLPFLNETAIPEIKAVIETAKPVYTEYIWSLNRNRIIAAEIIPIYSHNAGVQAITLAKDIGEQKRIISGIIKRELTSRLLLEQISDGIHISTLDGEIIYANDALSTRLGYIPDELLKLHLDDIDSSVSNSRFPKIPQEMLTKRSFLYETYYITKEGREIVTEVNSSKIEYYGEEAILSISRDITHRLSNIDSLEVRSMKIELEKSTRDFEIYTRLLQHDLRNDLQLVRSQIDVSNLEPLSSNQSMSDTLNVIQAAVERMVKLLDMLTISTEIGGQDLINCLMSTSSQAKMISPDLQIQIENNTDNDSVQVIAGRLLPFVWINIFRNTAHFASPKARNEVTISRNAEKVIIDITDNGPGVSDIIEKKLFEKGVSTTGSGYGLFLCRKIVEAYKGTIELVNDSGKGAHFRVTLLAA